MDTNKYQIFLKVLEHRSFSKAAAELGYTQSAVSHSIAVMEKEFGFQLLNRKDNKISLTRAGIDLLPHIRMWRARRTSSTCRFSRTAASNPVRCASRLS